MQAISTCRRAPAPNPAAALPRAALLRLAVQHGASKPQQALPLGQRLQRCRCSRLPPTAAAADAAPTVGTAGEVEAQVAEVQPLQQQEGQQQAQQQKPKRRLAAVLAPFSDPAANSKLLALCVAQALGSVATLMHETYLPVFLADELGCSHTKIGGLQGTAQFLAKLSGSVSGTLGDVVSPARMVILGAALTAANKPMYAASGAVAALAGTTACLYWIAFAKIFDRMAKGIREAPSKALIGELAAASGDSAAAAFGLRQSLTVAGGMVGAAAASLALRLTGGSYTLVFALSTVPAVAALLLLAAAFGPRSTAGAEVPAPAPTKGVGSDGADAADGNGAAPGSARLSVGDKARALLGVLRPAYWQALAVVGLLYMARFDYAFAALRARTFMDKAALPALGLCVAATTTALAVPMGLRAKASVGARNRVLLWGAAMLIGADLAFAYLPSVSGMFVGALLLGVHMAMTHGVSIAMLASYIPSTALPGLGRVAGTAWSLTDLMLAGVLACANFLAGWLNERTIAAGRGGVGCFLGGAAACGLSMAALLAFSVWGDLGREDELAAPKEGAAAVEGSKVAAPAA